MLMRHGRIKNPQKEENLKERSPGLKETTLFQQDVIRRNCGWRKYSKEKYKKLPLSTSLQSFH